MAKNLGGILIIAIAFISGYFIGYYGRKTEGESLGSGKETFRVAESMRETFRDTVGYRKPEPVKTRRLGLLSGAEAPAQDHSGLGSSDGARAPLIPVKGSAQDYSAERFTGEPEEVPRMELIQREYAGEDYRAWVSGYDPRLDSIMVFPKREVVTMREQILKPESKHKRWGIGVFAGYGLTPHGFQPCAGISVNYNLWNF